MTVVLEPPLTRSSGWTVVNGRRPEPLDTGPRFVRTAQMSRWHRPRSGQRQHDGRITYGLWCGQSIYREFLDCDERPTDLPVCATCEGRAIGAGQDEWRRDGPGLIFTPRRLTPPKTCPGSRRSLYEQISPRVGRCLVCGSAEPLRSMGGPYNGRTAVTSHPPGPDLVPGCPFHGWQDLVLHAGAVTCGCTIPPDTTRKPIPL
jgi:hypothetical protein